MISRLPALELADRAAERARDGQDIVPTAGVPVLPMPEHVVAAVTEVAGRAFPRVSRGSSALREALATELAVRHGLDVDPERELLITHGAQHGMGVVLRALLDAGDEVLVPTPTYFFDGMLRLARARPTYVRTRAADGWAVDPERLEAAVGPSTRAVLLCNPNNPTGHTPTRDELSAVLDVAARHDLVVLADESYRRYGHDGPGYLPQQSLRDRHPRLVTVTSLSKDYAFTHWRVGYVHAPAPLLDRVHAAFEWDSINVGDIAQAAALAAVTGPQDWLDRAFAPFTRRRDLLLTVLGDGGFPVASPSSGIFAFPDLSRLGRTGRDLEELLLDQGIVAVAGDAFAGPDDHARLLYGGPSSGIAELGRRLARLAEAAV